jgi:integrase
MIVDNPAVDLDKVQVDPVQIIPFTDTEVEKILVAARKHSKKIYAFVLFLRYSGLRMSDACMLSKNQIDGNRLRVRTKKAKTDVSIWLPDSVVTALNDFRSTTPSHYFWSGNSELHGLTNLYRNNFLKRVFTAAKIKGHPHQSRHTFASKLLESGASIENVAAALGNTPQIVAEHYAA